MTRRVAVSFAAVVTSLTRMRLGELRAAPRRPRGGHAIREGLSYVRHRPDIMLTMVIVGMIGTFGLNFQVTTALMARLVFDNARVTSELGRKPVPFSQYSYPLLKFSRETNFAYPYQSWPAKVGGSAA